MAPVEEEKVEEVVMKEEEKKPELPKDAEADEVECSDARYPDALKMNVNDSTLNVVVTCDSMVSALRIEQMPLCAASRLNVGVTKGRYLFETEILTLTGNNTEARVGFSLADSSIFLGDKGTMSFSSYGTFSLDGSAVPTFKTRRLTKGDVIGLLINRTEEGNANTISVFLNGYRAGEPQKIPDSFDGALFPHVLVRDAVVSVNLTKQVIKKLPFTCRTIGDASKDHLTGSSVSEVDETSIVVPLGFNTEEWVQNYIAENAMENFVVISKQFWNEWQEKSNLKKQDLRGDVLEAFFKIMGLRKRKFICTVGNNFLSDERKKFIAKFSSAVKTIAVFPETAFEGVPTNTTFYKDVTVPTKEEGWTEVRFATTVEAAEESIQKWQKKCKNCTKVEDFEATDKLKEKIAKWEKFLVSTKKEAEKNKKAREIALKLANGEEVKEEEEPKEEKKEEKKEGEKEEEVVPASSVDTQDFAEEDWMLAALRMELHTLCHAFREDVKDKERTAFSSEFLLHYYKLYAPAGRQLFLAAYGCRKESELVELIKDTINLEDNLMLPLLAADASFDDFVNLTEEARQERRDRIGAGDEGAQLKFKAQKKGAPKGGMKGNGQVFGRGPIQHYPSKGASKGGKGPSVVQKIPPQSQPQRYVNQGAARPGAHPMRTIPGTAPGALKRPQVSSFQSAPKRRF